MTSFELQGVCGPQNLKQGQKGSLRTTADGALVVQFSHARFQEAVLRGNVYTLSTTQFGVVVSSSTIIETPSASPIVGIFNPRGSQTNAVIMRTIVSNVSGTQAGGGVLFGVIPNVPDLTATASNDITNHFTFQRRGSRMNSYIGATMSTTAPNLLRPIMGTYSGTISLTSFMPLYQSELTDGEIIVTPGNALGIYTAGAGSGWHMMGSLTWEEIPVRS